MRLKGSPCLIVNILRLFLFFILNFSRMEGKKPKGEKLLQCTTRQLQDMNTKNLLIHNGASDIINNILINKFSVFSRTRLGMIVVFGFYLVL